MPHALTELDDFTSPIVVPDGTDSRTNAAEVVEALAQGLANRTKAINEHVAWFDVANTFTQTNTFEDTVLVEQGIGDNNDASTGAALTVFTSADDDPHSGNRWKKIIQALIGGVNADAMIWSGIASHDGQLLFTINARWDPAAQQWVQQDNTLHSFALMMAHNGVVTLSRKDSGSGPWASWPVTGTTSLRVQSAAFGGGVTVGADLVATGNVTGADVISVDDVLAGDAVTAGGIITGTGGLVSGQDISLPGGKHVLYSPTASSFRRVRMAAGTTPQSEADVAFTGGHWITAAVAYTISVPLQPFAAGTEIDAVWLRYEASGADGFVELVRSSVSDWLTSPSGATPTLTVLASAAIVTTGSGVKTAIATLGTPEVVSNTAYDYWIRITGNSGSSHDIYAAALTVKLSSPGID